MSWCWQHGGQSTNSEELINKLRVALEPLRNQVSVPMPPINPNEAPFRPQAPQRHGLLGNAPPGYNPMMGPRSFGPQGMLDVCLSFHWRFVAAASVRLPAESRLASKNYTAR